MTLASSLGTKASYIGTRVLAIRFREYFLWEQSISMWLYVIRNITKAMRLPLHQNKAGPEQESIIGTALADAYSKST